LKDAFSVLKGTERHVAVHLAYVLQLQLFISREVTLVVSVFTDDSDVTQHEQR